MSFSGVDDQRERVAEAIAFARRADVPFMAAAIAYYAFVSVLPALLLILALGSAVGNEAITDQLLAVTRDFLTPAGEATLTEAIAGEGGRGGATVIGVVLLAWSTTRVFRGLDKAFSKVYGSTERTGFLDQVRDGALVVGTIGVALWGMVVLGSVLATVVPFGGDLVGLAGLLLGLVVVFLPLYYVFPDVEMTVREALPGTVLVAIGWVCLQAGFQVYATLAPSFQLYGVIGGILLLVTWFYLAAGVVLAGAVVNAILAGRANRQLQQDGRRT